jgi:hypothetical protein
MEFKNELHPIVTKLFNVSFTFIGSKANSSIPLIGDISPDASPLWLSRFISNCRSKETSTNSKSEVDWFTIWNIENAELDFITTGIKAYDETGSDPESGFFNYCEGNFRFYYHNSLSNSRPNFSHYHCDDLSFTLMIDDKQIIGDIGRSTYIHSHPLSQYAKSPYGHNTVFYDQIPISPSQSKLFPSVYAQPIVTIKESYSRDSYKLQIQHDGFRRIDKNILFNREFQVDKMSFILQDSWVIPRTSKIMTRFHLAPEIKEVIKEEGYLLLIEDSSDEQMKFYFDIDELTNIEISRGIFGFGPKECKGWMFSQYGLSRPAYTIDFHQDVSKNIINTFKIIIDEEF